MYWVRRALFPLFAAAWLAGWILNEQPRPWVWLYLIPAPAVAVYGLFEFFSRLRRASLARHVLVASLTGLALYKTLAIDCRWNRQRQPPPDAIRIVHWNVSRVDSGLVPSLEALAPYRPDVVVLSEARPSKDLPFYAEKVLGLPHTRHDSGISLLSRFPFTTHAPFSPSDVLVWGVRLYAPSGELDVLCVDVPSHPLLNRVHSLRPLSRWVENRTDPAPLLVIGDFNTPRDSRAFSVFRAHLRHAYEIAGYGWPYTWPVPIPLYAIDHAWVSPNVVVHRYRLRDAPWSDHRRQIFEISLPTSDSS